MWGVFMIALSIQNPILLQLIALSILNPILLQLIALSMRKPILLQLIALSMRKPHSSSIDRIVNAESYSSSIDRIVNAKAPLRFGRGKGIYKKEDALAPSLRDSVGTRTQDPQLRRLLLYPAELRNHPDFWKSAAKVILFPLIAKYFMFFLINYQTPKCCQTIYLSLEEEGKKV